ncbi:unnamed protein product [Lathyrus sativus]|nr:unnamed protein product [Lathyrus sativus]
MEASKMNVFVAVMVAVLVIATSGVSAADSPAPSPASDATTLFVPSAVASLIALAFGFLF